MVLIMSQIKNIKEVTDPLEEQILKGYVNTMDEMRAWLKPLGYSDIRYLLYISHLTSTIRHRFPIIVTLLVHQVHLLRVNDHFNCFIDLCAE
jgi:hypothetical protein